MHKIHDNHNNGNTSRTEYSKRFISLRNSNNNNKIGCLLLISYWCLRAPVFLLFYLPFFSIFAIISFFKWVLYVQSVVHHSTVGLFYFHVFYRLSVCYAHFFFHIHIWFSFSFWRALHFVKNVNTFSIEPHLRFRGIIWSDQAAHYGKMHTICFGIKKAFITRLMAIIE